MCEDPFGLGDVPVRSVIFVARADGRILPGCVAFDADVANFGRVSAALERRDGGELVLRYVAPDGGSMDAFVAAARDHAWALAGRLALLSHEYVSPFERWTIVADDGTKRSFQDLHPQREPMIMRPTALMRQSLGLPPWRTFGLDDMREALLCFDPELDQESERFRLAYESKDRIAGFLLMYAILSNSKGPKQHTIDSFILECEPDVEMRPSRRAKGGLETIFTYLRNRVMHHPDLDVGEVRTAMAARFRRLSRITQAAVLGGSYVRED